MPCYNPDHKAPSERTEVRELFFDELVRDFEAGYMPKLALPTRRKYQSLLRCHIRPELSSLTMEELTTRRVDQWLASKAHLSWGSRNSLRNLLSSIITRANVWETYNGKNPTEHVYVGRRKAVYEKRKMTVEQSRKLLNMLNEDFRIIVMVSLFCGLRISEVMGLCWKHIDFDRGMVLVRQRYYRGDVDTTKSEKSIRDIPFGYLAGLLRRYYPGIEAREDFCFTVVTGHGTPARDDRTLRRYFLRPAAEKLGLYYPGFGFHSFRREAVTSISSKIGAIQACRVAGHSRMDTTLLYGLDDYLLQESAIMSMQEPYMNVLRARE